MGMFDSFYDKDGHEWQTKAFTRVLAAWEIGDAIPTVAYPHQVEVVGDFIEADEDVRFVESYATIRDGRLEAVPVERDESLPLLNYGGTWISEGDDGGHPEND